MLILLLFSFLAGIATVLSPCILPLLPIILSSSDSSGKQRPLGVVTGFVASFTFFTLFLSLLVRLSGIPADTMRLLSIVVLAGFGSSLLIPGFQAKLEVLFSRLGVFAPKKQHAGFAGGLLVGFSLGLLWTPCVGPILAAVISLAITGAVTAQAALITFAYALGTALPMFLIMMAGSAALQKVPWLVKNTGRIQKAFGILMILTALAILLGWDRQFQVFVLTTLPNYSSELTKIESLPNVANQIEEVLQPKD